jgi:alanine racemase
VYSIHTIKDIINGSALLEGPDYSIQYLLHDSRRAGSERSVFFALKTPHGNGHLFVPDAYAAGVRNFVVSEKIATHGLKDANVILVGDTLRALQTLARHHREQFHFPVIGITGSNGKTIVKEWLYQLLQDDYRVIRSPKSYNSQVGVPISVWSMGAEHNLGIFEAGISQKGEMDALREIILPQIGILTNIGEAHDAQFSSKEEKLQEKLKLFNGVEVLIGPYEWIYGKKENVFSWGHQPGATLRVTKTDRSQKGTRIEAAYKNGEDFIIIPFSDEASVQNALTCWCTLLYLGIGSEKIRNAFARLHPVDMRLQMRHAINNCLLINDSYSADTTSLKIALDFLQQQSMGLKRTVILSDFSESGKEDPELYKEIGLMVQSSSADRLILIGDKAYPFLKDALPEKITLAHYPSTDDFAGHFQSSQYFNEMILIKGARVFEFERIARLFEKKLHGTVLEINLNALRHNLREYGNLLQPGTRVMAMVKAFSYGSGGAEIASVLQYHNVQFLGVAYGDEGVDLVKSGIRLPIMVMNAEESSFASIIEYNLQPVLYSMELLHHFAFYLRGQGLQDYPVHIEIESGMNRLGFAPEQVEELARILSESGLFRVISVFSHLAASEDPAEDAYTKKQAGIFTKATDLLQQKLAYPLLRHIANSAAILRHPDLQMDMVRLGIGLYGIETVDQPSFELQAVATLRSTIAQVKRVKKGESVSYNRKWIAERDSLVATVRIGYADGYSRQFSNGTGKMWVGGRLAPVIGSVCMDMTMIDITGLEGVGEGDEVVIFGPPLPVQTVAGWIKTIPYEIMTSVSQRVKRVYFHE